MHGPTAIATWMESTEWRLWSTALSLGLWVASARVAHTVAKPVWTWRLVFANFMLSMTACIFAVLYSWEDLAVAHSQQLILRGGVAGWCGPELPTILGMVTTRAPAIAKMLMRLWIDKE